MKNKSGTFAVVRSMLLVGGLMVGYGFEAAALSPPVDDFSAAAQSADDQNEKTLVSKLTAKMKEKTAEAEKKVGPCTISEVEVPFCPMPTSVINCDSIVIPANKLKCQREQQAALAKEKASIAKAKQEREAAKRAQLARCDRDWAQARKPIEDVFNREIARVKSAYAARRSARSSVLAQLNLRRSNAAAADRLITAAERSAGRAKCDAYRRAKSDLERLLRSVPFAFNGGGGGFQARLSALADSLDKDDKAGTSTCRGDMCTFTYCPTRPVPSLGSEGSVQPPVLPPEPSSSLL